MDEIKSAYLRSCIQILKYSLLEEIICLCSGSNKLHKLMLKMGSQCQKGNEYSSNLEEYFIIR